MGRSKWQRPGKIKEDPGDQLRAFGIESIPGARITMTDPAVSQVQQGFMGADLARKRAGKKTRTGMTAAQLEEFAGTRRRGLPKRKR
jgi:hypothetical protein